MTAVLILIVIFTFVGVTSYFEGREKTKRQKMKIQAALRQEEMARGYAPGSFSSDIGEEVEESSSSSHRMSREELEKGISDLDERIKNLDSIMKNKK